MHRGKAHKVLNEICRKVVMHSSHDSSYCLCLRRGDRNWPPPETATLRIRLGGGAEVNVHKGRRQTDGGRRVI